jgi:hypothetical protein
VTPPASACANCGDALAGEYCSRCGQRALDLHRPFSALVSDAVGDLLNLDTRLIRTLRPLMARPGAVAKSYIAGRRASHVPPLKSYLIAALIFFSLFTVFPSDAPVSVVVQGSPEEAAAKGRGGVSFSLPARIGYFDQWYQAARTRAMKDPQRFASIYYANIPRAFFVFLPLFALFLELLYRKQGYVVDHLVFALYYHAFVFLEFSLIFLAGHLSAFVPTPVRWIIGLSLWGWLFAYLPMALRRVYGGSRLMTGMKLVTLGLLYAFAFGAAQPLIIGAALLQF